MQLIGGGLVDIWTKRLMELFDQSNTTYREISKATGIPISALHRYITGASENIPLDRLTQLAKYFNVKSEYLMGWETDPPALRPKQRILFDRSKELTDSQMDAVLNIVDAILKDKDNDNI